MRKIFFNQRGLRSGWRLLIFLAMVVGFRFLSNWAFSKIPGLAAIEQLPNLHPVGLIYDSLFGLALVGLATWIMSRIEHRSLADYGIPLRNAFGRDFWIGGAWGMGSASLVVAAIAALGGYRIVGLAIHGTALWYFSALWVLANLLIGFAEEIQFRAYLLSTLADGIGFWTASILISAGFGALHYFLKPHERWEDFASTGLLSLFLCLALRRTGSLAFAIGFHAAFDLANLFVWSGQNGGELGVGHLLETRWQGPQWITGGLLGPETSWTIFPVIALMFWLFHRKYRETKFPLA
jgi:membrane protease YdiL (CAAX protease family)